jgi:hypothetical protein
MCYCTWRPWSVPRPERDRHECSYRRRRPCAARAAGARSRSEPGRSRVSRRAREGDGRAGSASANGARACLSIRHGRSLYRDLRGHRTIGQCGRARSGRRCSGRPRRRLGRNASEIRPNVTVRVRLLGVHSAQFRLHLTGARSTSNARVHVVSSPLDVNSEFANTSGNPPQLVRALALCLDIDQVVTQEFEIGKCCRR